MDILLFSHDPVYAKAAMQAGLSGVIVDWESIGKSRRQAGFDTEVNRGRAGDLARMRAALGGQMICRIDNQPGTRAEQARLAVDLGADEVWLPMVRGVEEVEDCLKTLAGRARLGILVETREALRLGREFTCLPLARVFVGLNDLSIDLGRGSLFEPLVDGTVDAFRADFEGPLGVAGVTLPTGGHPVPQRLLLAKMAHLGCAFGVARRSFRRDVPAERVGPALRAIRAEYVRLRRRSVEEIARDQDELCEAVVGVAAGTWR